MAYFIGTDEAGYGPNLGPLVITATVWRAASDISADELYELLGDCVCRQPSEPSDERLTIADSKRLYQPGGGLGLLERGVAAACHACGSAPASWRGAWRHIAGLDSRQLDAVPWHDGYDHDLPLACELSGILRSVERLREGLARAGIQLCAIRSAAVFPAEFNRLLDCHGNKSSLLSACTLELVRQLLETCTDAPVCVSCDKHGGRNRYGPLLQQLFPEFLVEVRRESRELSVYRWGPEERRIEFSFAAQGERVLTAALASMVSKYLRELAMKAFNDYWLREIPGLRPTAGYPLDAARFKQAIAPRQQALGIPDNILWRCR
jgi:hypothetical protein